MFQPMIKSALMILLFRWLAYEKGEREDDLL